MCAKISKGETAETSNAVTLAFLLVTTKVDYFYYSVILTAVMITTLCVVSNLLLCF